MHHLFNGLSHESFTINDSMLEQCILRIPTYIKRKSVLVFRDYKIVKRDGYITDIARHASHNYLKLCESRESVITKYLSKNPIYAGTASSAAMETDKVICADGHLIDLVRETLDSKHITDGRSALVGLLFASIKSDGYVIYNNKYFSARILFEYHVSNFNIGELVYICEPYYGKVNSKIKLKQLMDSSRPTGNKLKSYTH